MASSDVEFIADKCSSPIAGAGNLQQTVPTDSSPDFKCPVCLERFDNTFCLNPCLQKPCFSSIQEWSEAKECPLCKLPFQSVSHSAGAEEDSKEYVPRPFSKPDLWGHPYPTSRKSDTAVSLCRSFSSRQTDETSTGRFSDQINTSRRSRNE